MSHQDKQIRVALQAWAQAQAHPSYEELAAYATGELNPSSAEQVADHLSLCRGCAAIILELTDNTIGEPERPAASDAENGWEALQARLQAAGELPAPPQTAPQESSRESPPVAAFPPQTAAQKSSSRRRWLPALAAAIAGMALGLALGLLGPGPTPDQRPTSDTQVYTVASAVRGIPPRHETVEVSPNAGKLVILLPTFANRADRYRVEVKDSTGTVLWKPWEAKPDRYGNVSVEFATAIVEKLGSYRIELYPQDSEDPSELVFEIEMIPEPTEP